MLDSGMSLEEVRDELVAEGYPAVELAWILNEKYKTEADILQFMVEYNEIDNYRSLKDATKLFDCSLSELKKIYDGE